MQIIKLKGILVHLFLAISITLAEFTSDYESNKRQSDLYPPIQPHSPTNCLYDTFHYYFSKCYTKASDAYEMAYRYFVSNRPDDLPQRLNPDEIVIKVRRFRPLHRQNPYFPWTQPASKSLKQETDSFEEFRNALEYPTDLITDTNGKVVGIQPQLFQYNRDNVQIQRGQQGIRNADPGFNGRRTQTSIGIAREPLPRGDQDQCCTTYEKFFINSTLLDVFGKRHNILQHADSGSHQFIRHGVCGDKGLCRGVCVEMYVNMGLAVRPSSGQQRVTYKFFQIPGYCACKNFG